MAPVILHFPTVLGAVVPTYNSTGVSGSLVSRRKHCLELILGRIFVRGTILRHRRRQKGVIRRK